MFGRIRHLVIKEFRQMLRDPKMKVVLFVGPIFQVLILANAVSTDVKKVPMAIYDLDNTPQSRELIRSFVDSQYFVAQHYIQTDAQQQFLIDKFEVNASLRINRGFAQDILKNNSAQVQFIVDGTDSNTSAIVLNYASRIIEQYTAKINRPKIEILLQKTGPIAQIDLRSRAWFNENLESKLYFVPGVVAMVVMIVTFLLTAMSIVREKEIGTIEQLIVSPLRPLELIIGKLIPFGIVGIIDVFLVTCVAVIAFAVPIRGSLVLLFFCSCLFLMSTLGLGLFISSISSTQQEAVMSMFFVVQPMVLLSGFIFPVANMPKFVQAITLADPLRYYLVCIRGIFLKGSTIEVLWPQMLALLILGSVIITLSTLRFHKTLG
jgi:ABC-2 type transport system permease protein